MRARIILRQTSLGILWSIASSALIWLLTVGLGSPFDRKLGVSVVVMVMALQAVWTVAHTRSVRRILADPTAEDYGRSPVRELVIPGRSKEWLLPILVGNMPLDLGAEITKIQDGCYLIRRRQVSTRARVRLSLVSEDDDLRVHINGRIPWWVGVDEARSLNLVIQVRDYLEKYAAARSLAR